MKLSTRARYGIHAMFDLAQHAGSGPQSIKTIAQRQEIPEQYLEQLIAPLRRSGLVSSVRGASGGYMLAKQPDEISIGEILRASDVEFIAAECVLDIDSCSRSSRCPTRLIWEKLRDRMNSVVDSVTLSDMLEDHKRLSAEHGFDDELA